MYKLFTIEGEATDGTYMFTYVQSMTILAIDQQTAIDYANINGQLLGDVSSWNITEHSIDCPGIIDYSYSRDY